MIKFSINNRAYRTCRLNAFQQLHVARRILPLLAKLPEMVGMSLQQIVADDGALKRIIANNLDGIRLDVIAETLSGLKDEDVDFVFNTCLDGVEIKDAQGNEWHRVRVNGTVMYDCIGLHETMGSAINVIKDNLSDFFSVSDLISNQEAEASESPSSPSPMTKHT